MERQQKQHIADGGSAAEQKHHPNPELAAAADRGKELLEKIKQARKVKSGHWEECCGVKIWVPD